MLAIAAEVGYSETAFITEDRGDGAYRVRYFSPLAEVPFCGHATVATAVALGPGAHRFDTNAGEVPVTVDEDRRATLTSVATSTTELTDRPALLAALGWAEADLDPALPPRVAYAGAFHPIVAVRTRQRLADLDYDVPALTALMTARDWTTVQLVWRESADTFHVRDPFPVGGVYEDPATGAAAAAFGGYLRELGLVGRGRDPAPVAGRRPGPAGTADRDAGQGRAGGTRERHRGADNRMTPAIGSFLDERHDDRPQSRRGARRPHPVQRPRPGGRPR